MVILHANVKPALEVKLLEDTELIPNAVWQTL